MIATARHIDVAIESELARRGITLKRAGRELVGPCPRCGGRDRFGVHLGKQIWNCRGCGKGGDVIGLVQHLDGCGYRDAVETLTGERPRCEPAHMVDSNRPFPTVACHSQEDYERRQHAKAAWLWSRRLPIAGSPAERYLRTRGIEGLALPPTLAFLPPHNGEQHPAMVAAFGPVDEPEPGVLGEPQHVDALHFTLLKPDGSDKADVTKPKFFLARPLGRPIVLAPIGDMLALHVSEGIEDGLSLVCVFERVGVWAAGSATNMPALAQNVPGFVESVTIWAHDDVSGRRGARELAALLDGRGIEVFIEGVS